MVEINGLKKYFPVKKNNIFNKGSFIKAVDSISFVIPEGKTLGMVGESGSGKTTASRAILRLIEPDAGIIKINKTNVKSLNKDKLREFRKNMQIVFQDPYGSLNPNMTIGRIITEPLRIHTPLKKKDLEKRLEELLKIVGLDISHANRYPHEFSGGQRQRIGIARAIALNPKFIILDEPVSALDVSIQGQILNLISDLQEKLNLTYLFVSHDLAVVEHISDYVVVMYLGKIVEENFTADLYGNPLHPYTKSLIKSIPENRPVKHGFTVLPGEIPSPEKPPKGCYFHPRCPNVMDICKIEYPKIRMVEDSKVSCHLYI